MRYQGNQDAPPSVDLQAEETSYPTPVFIFGYLFITFLPLLTYKKYTKFFLSKLDHHIYYRTLYDHFPQNQII